MSFLNPNGTPTWVFTPFAGQIKKLTLWNTSNNPVYFGGANVSQFNGTPLPPNAKISLPVTQATYVCSQVNTTGTLYTQNSSALNAGATVLTLSASATVSSAYLVLGTATTSEVIQVNTPGTASSFTLATATLYDHKASSVVAAASLLPGQVQYE